MWNPLLQRTRLDWVQIEVSSVCNGRCRYCPHTAYRDVWQKRTLAPELIESILPSLHPKTYIHLQGWGEPFTHPQILPLIESIKKRGFKVGTTTNGTLLTQEKLERLVDIGLDLLAFSTAGCSAAENDRNRQGTSLKQVISCIEKIQQLKAAKKSAVPKIHIAQMLLRSSLKQLDTYPAFWKNLGAEQVVLSSLSLIPHADLQSEAQLADSPEEWDDLKEKLYEMRISSSLKDVLHFHLASPFLLFKGCSENIEKSAVIGSNGDIASCVMVNLAVPDPVNHWVHENCAARNRESWGNLTDSPFNTIWKQKEFKAFRKQDEMNTDQCANCLKRSIETLETACLIDPSSMTCRWQVIKEANEEKEAIRRMEKRRMDRG